MSGGAEPAFLAALEAYLAASLEPAGEGHPRLREAMAHILLGGGKRLRPRLLRAAAALGSPEAGAVLAGGAALEMLHSYSLVHDDLPVMDDDDWRRGKPTVHRAYGEPMALLAGDALQALAFEHMARALARAALPAAEGLAALAEFAAAAGWRGLVGGQAADLMPREDLAPAAQIAWMQERKTGCLIRAALDVGARLGRLPDGERESLARAGALLGRAFQTVDDLLDASASRDELGKTPGKDRAQGKRTLLALEGPEAARAAAEAQLAEALDLIPARPEAAPLRDLAGHLVHRRS